MYNRVMENIFRGLPRSFIQFIQLTRPLFLLGGVLLYALGAGIAKYLGHQVDWTAYWLGQSSVTLLQLSAHYLNEYFDYPADQENLNRTPFSGGSGVDGLPRSTALLAATITLTTGAAVTVLLYAAGYLNIPVAMVLALAFAGSFFYSVPPLRLAGTGYGELTTSVLVANLVPAFALLLQTGDFHRLLALSTFPLTFLHLAMLLAFSLPDYANDLKFEKRTLMVRLGWQKGMSLHNLAIVAAYLFFVFAVLQGLPWQIAWPGFLSIPLGLFQILMMNQIARGGKPRWSLLTFNALALFALTAYFITFAYWTA